MTNKKQKLGYPYDYGDAGAEKSFFEHENSVKIIKICALAGVGTVMSPGVALASVGKKATAESTRAAACAAAGACMTIAAQQAKCGNMPAATAAFCGAAIAMCIEKTAQAVSDAS